MGKGATVTHDSKTYYKNVHEFSKQSWPNIPNRLNRVSEGEARSWRDNAVGRQKEFRELGIQRVGPAYELQASAAYCRCVAMLAPLLTSTPETFVST